MRTALLLAAGAIACSDGSSGMEDAAQPDAGVTGDAASEEDVGAMTVGLLENLRSLGVPTEQRPLEDENGQPIPDEYSPFGPVLELGVRKELFVVGPMIADAPATLLEGASTDTAFETIDSWAAVDWPWAIDAPDLENEPGTTRAAAAGDLLAGGLDEIAVAYVDGGTNQLRLKVLNAAEPRFEESDHLLVDEVGAVTEVAIAAGDFDGDGVDELAVAYVLIVETEVSPGAIQNQSRATVIRASLKSGVIEVQRTPIATIYGRLAESHMTLDIRVGRLDYDDPEETVIVANEVAAQNPFSSNVARARARFFVLDDAEHNFLERRSGDLIGETELGEIQVAAVASVALGDLDQDSFDEIILAGLTFRDSYDVSGCDPIAYIVTVLDDGIVSHAEIGTTRVESEVEVCGNDGRAAYMQQVRVNVVNVDGIGAPEVQVNEMILGYDQGARPIFDVEHRISEAQYYGSCKGQPYDRGSVAVSAGDVDGDGRGEIIHHCRSNDGIDVFGLDIGATEITKAETIPIVPNGAYPIIVGVDVEHDGKRNAMGEVVEGSQVLELMADSSPESKYVITEPVVLAALAAPPCQLGIGQNTDACVTTFGQTDSVSLEDESSYKLKATAGFGINVMGGVVAQSEADFVAKLGIAVGHASSNKRSISKTVTYTTGPLEDTVVFAAVPYTRFRYRVRSAFDESLIGTIVSVFFPHRPLVQQVERGFYNSHVLSPDDRIGDEVFSHTPGDISTYPGAEDVPGVLLLHCESRDFPPCTALQAGAQAVGQGTGETELGIEVATEMGVKAELELTAGIEVETTIATVKVTIELEAEKAWSLGTTVGQSTSYSGAVGSIDAEHFADNQYSFGMFVYSYGDRGRFHVVNYWVEQ